jgi:hypothetical protein
LRYLTALYTAAQDDSAALALRKIQSFSIAWAIAVDEPIVVFERLSSIQDKLAQRPSSPRSSSESARRPTR